MSRRVGVPNGTGKELEKKKSVEQREVTAQRLNQINS